LAITGRLNERCDAYTFAFHAVVAGNVHQSSEANFGFNAAIWGLGFGIFNTLIILQIMGSVAKSAMAFALAILTSAMGIGQFLSPIYYSYINSLFGFQSPRAPWILATACFAAALAISPVIVAIKSRRSAFPAAG
jgi:hypothetical protein